VSSFILNVLSAEQALSPSTANTVGAASFVRLFNNTAAAQLVTKQNVTANTANVSFTIASNQEAFLLKTPADTLTANAGVLATSVKVRGG
jgi:hypothetical protein